MMIYLLLLFPAAFALNLWPGSESQAPLQNFEHSYDPFASNGLDDFVTATMEELHTPGMAVAIIHGSNTFSKSYGYSNVEDKIPMTNRTLFLAASTTKSYTAALMSKLIDQNYTNPSFPEKNLTWDTKLHDLTPDDFVLQDPYTTTHVNLVDALSHRTGMPRHDFTWVNGHIDVKEQVRSLRYLPLHRELREGWEYCNLMFTAVSHALQTLTGRKQGDLLREWIFEPLGMKESFYNLDEALQYAKSAGGKVEFATGYMFDNTTKQLLPVPFPTLPHENGAGGVISNVLDYTHWVHTFLHPENDSNPLTASAIKEMTTPQMLQPSNLIVSASADAYGLGLDVQSYRNHKLVEHGGADNGYMTVMAWLPDLDWGCVIMCNGYELAQSVVYLRLLDDFLGVPVDERNDVLGVLRNASHFAGEKLSAARERLYPDAKDLASVAPALPLHAYEGRYEHPAYHGITLSLSPPHPQIAAKTLPGAPLPLYVQPEEKSYLNISGTLHHVSGEYWYAVMTMGVPSWVTTEAVKAKFDVSAGGKVVGLRLQAESALEELSYFEKVV